MTCPRCQQENPPQAKFCLECATPLALRCAGCGTQLPAGAKFCFECAAPVRGPGSPPRFASPETYTTPLPVPVSPAIRTGGPASGSSSIRARRITSCRSLSVEGDAYAALMLVRERHAEMVAAARRDALLREMTRPRRAFRAALGTALIRLGTWLLGEHDPAPATR